MKTNTKSGKSKSAESDSIHELFEHQLQDIYWAEKELGRFMPEIVGQVNSRELVQTLREHMKITEKQVQRLENIFEIMDAEVKAEKCEGMEGLIKEAKEIIEMADKGTVRDAFIVGAVQKMEHYEMASYGTLRALATIIGEYEVASLLGETLEEEKEADMKLTEVAENVVNIDASRDAGELEEEEEEFDELEEEEELEDEDEDEVYGRARGKSKSRSKR